MQDAYKILCADPEAEIPKMWGTGYKCISMLFTYNIRHKNYK
jgi:hypothetical protein